MSYYYFGVWFEFDGEVLVADVCARTELTMRMFVEANRTESVWFEWLWDEDSIPQRDRVAFDEECKGSTLIDDVEFDVFLCVFVVTAARTLNDGHCADLSASNAVFADGTSYELTLKVHAVLLRAPSGGDYRVDLVAIETSAVMIEFILAQLQRVEIGRR